MAPMVVDELIAEAAALPLRDAAYWIWRQKSAFDRLEPWRFPPRQSSTPENRDQMMQEISALLKHEHDFAQDGPSFERLKRAHPEVGDAEAKAAIVAAV